MGTVALATPEATAVTSPTAAAVGGGSNNGLAPGRGTAWMPASGPADGVVAARSPLLPPQKAGPSRVTVARKPLLSPTVGKSITTAALVVTGLTTVAWTGGTWWLALVILGFIAAGMGAAIHRARMTETGSSQVERLIAMLKSGRARDRERATQRLVALAERKEALQSLEAGIPQLLSLLEESVWYEMRRRVETVLEAVAKAHIGEDSPAWWSGKGRGGEFLLAQLVADLGSYDLPQPRSHARQRLASLVSTVDPQMLTKQIPWLLSRLESQPGYKEEIGIREVLRAFANAHIGAGSDVWKSRDGEGVDILVNALMNQLSFKGTPPISEQAEQHLIALAARGLDVKVSDALLREMGMLILNFEDWLPGDPRKARTARVLTEFARRGVGLNSEMSDRGWWWHGWGELAGFLTPPEFLYRYED